MPTGKISFHKIIRCLPSCKSIAVFSCFALRMKAPLLTFTDKGIYCAAADVYIDPWKPVSRALITHGHSDHARWGSQHYLCTEAAQPVIKYRLGQVSIQTIPYGEVLTIQGVQFSFHPAGHIVGSAQIRVAHRGEVWVVSGDYKLEDDGVSGAFEPLRCDTFITESTFGLPIYHWKPQEEVFADMNAWWLENQAQDKVSVITAYALGKAQRILKGLDLSIGPVFTHGAIENTNEILRSQGVPLPATRRVLPGNRKSGYSGGLVLAPPAAVDTLWMRQFKSYSLGVASGWMAMRGTRRRRNADRGFVLSDHADWPGLNQAIRETGAGRIVVTHGYTELFSQWLRSTGLEAQAEKTAFEGEVLESTQPDNE